MAISCIRCQPEICHPTPAAELMQNNPTGSRKMIRRHVDLSQQSSLVSWWMWLRHKKLNLHSLHQTQPWEATFEDEYGHGCGTTSMCRSGGSCNYISHGLSESIDAWNGTGAFQLFNKVTLDFLLDQKKKEPTDENLMGYNDIVADEVFEGCWKKWRSRNHDLLSLLSLGSFWMREE